MLLSLSYSGHLTCVEKEFILEVFLTSREARQCLASNLRGYRLGFWSFVCTLAGESIPGALHFFSQLSKTDITQVNDKHKRV